MTTNTSCWDVFEACVKAISHGCLIESVSARDKEFHFQNWFGFRLHDLGLNHDDPGRNKYPDFSLVNFAEGYEIKGLAWPGREKNYDSNSQVPTGNHNGRQIFYVFGRYPAHLSEYESSSGGREYPVVDLVICHGDFLNADHGYIHKNKNIKGFGTYGDIMIRDRKMYVAPTPFALAEGLTGMMTLILPAHMEGDSRFRLVGDLTRIETNQLVIDYTFDLRTNVLQAGRIANPRAGTKHEFKAWRLKDQSGKSVTLLSDPILPDDNSVLEGE